MLHYRPQVSNKQLRITIAVCLAITAHVWLFSLTYELQTDKGPTVSLPRSVNVFLGQDKIPPVTELRSDVASKEIRPAKQVPQTPAKSKSTPLEQLPAEQGADRQPAVPEHAMPLQHDAPREQDPVRQPTQAVMPQEDSSSPSTTPADELQKIMLQQSEASAYADSGAAEAGVKLPGTLQMAYPRYQVNSPPTYPGLARKRGQEGTVILKVLVNSEGRVEELAILESSGFGLLDRAAAKALKKWLFEPGRRHNRKLAMWVKVPVTFQLKDK